MQLDEWVLKRTEEVTCHLLTYLGIPKDNLADVLPDVLSDNIGKLYILRQKEMIKEIRVTKSPRAEAKEALKGSRYLGNDPMECATMVANQRVEWWVNQIHEHIGHLEIAAESDNESFEPNTLTIIIGENEGKVT